MLYLVAQSSLTLHDTMDCSLPRLVCPWDSPGKNTGVGCHALLQGSIPTQGSNPVDWAIGETVEFLPNPQTNKNYIETISTLFQTQLSKLYYGWLSEEDRLLKYLAFWIKFHWIFKRTPNPYKIKNDYSR